MDPDALTGATLTGATLTGAAGVGTVGLVALAAVLIAVGLVVVYTLRLGAPPWPSTPRAVRALVKAVPARVEGEVLHLGCGWGGLTLALAAHYPQHRVIGVELSPVPWAVARLRALLKRCESLEILRADLHRVDLSRAGLVVCYLQSAAMARLADRMGREAAAGCWLVSNTFALPGWSPVSRHPVGDLFGTEILVYRQTMTGSEGKPAPGPVMRPSYNAGDS